MKKGSVTKPLYQWWKPAAKHVSFWLTFSLTFILSLALVAVEEMGSGVSQWRWHKEPCGVSQSAWAAVTKYQTGWLKQQILFSLGDWKSKIKVLASLVSPEASLLGSQMATFSVGPHVAFSLCACIPGVFLFL